MDASSDILAFKATISEEFILPHDDAQDILEWTLQSPRLCDDSLKEVHNIQVVKENAFMGSPRHALTFQLQKMGFCQESKSKALENDRARFQARIQLLEPCEAEPHCFTRTPSENSSHIGYNCQVFCEQKSPLCLKFGTETVSVNTARSVLRPNKKKRTSERRLKFGPFQGVYSEPPNVDLPVVYLDHASYTRGQIHHASYTRGQIHHASYTRGRRLDHKYNDSNQDDQPLNLSKPRLNETVVVQKGQEKTNFNVCPNAVSGTVQKVFSACGVKKSTLIGNSLNRDFPSREKVQRLSTSAHQKRQGLCSENKQTPLQEDSLTNLQIHFCSKLDLVPVRYEKPVKMVHNQSAQCGTSSNQQLDTHPAVGTLLKTGFANPPCGLAATDRAPFPPHVLNDLETVALCQALQSGQKPYQCPLCFKCFQVPSKMKLHFYTHIGFKPHSCHVCGKGFIRTSDLTVHIRTHTGERPFACEICEKCFASMRRLKEHRLYVHSGKKPFQCSECGKSFAKAHTLKCHMRIHTGEKPYECQVCAARFASSRSLRRHLKIHARGAPLTSPTAALPQHRHSPSMPLRC